MHYIVKSGNKQYTVSKGTQFVVDRLKADEGSEISLDLVYAYGDGKQQNPTKVKAKIVRHQRGKKLRILKYKAKSNYKRQYGFRHEETILEVL